jgi:hypothetical protein
MKRYLFAILLIATAAAFSACASAAETLGGASGSDFSGADFTGTWYVSEVLTPGGKTVDSSEMQLMGAGLTLELLEGGVYFVYGSDGEVLGQGQYSVTADVLTCTAGSQQTTYHIQDADTLRSISDDKSITVMARQPEPSPTATDEEISDEDISDSDTDQDAPEDSDMPLGETEAPVGTSDVTTNVPTTEPSN